MSAEDEFLRELLEDPAVGLTGPADPGGSGGPGAVVGLVAGARLCGVAARGLASLEHGVPISPETVFHVASVSKQFTAYAVAMLAAEGRLGLDEPVAAQLDWFPFGDITLRHLVHHVSGLRDQWALTLLSGRRMEDTITTGDLVTLVAGQRELNFAPGSQYSYCNTGYTLLAAVVEAVTGMRLREFCAGRIFGPLGMESTRFLDDHHDVIARRADSYYRRADGGYGRIALSYSNAGATSLNTTAGDLARWACHVMTPPALALLQERYTLTDGTELKYGGGVIVDEYRGFRALSHSGADAGYRSLLLVLPAEKAAAIVLSNVAELPVQRLAHAAIDRLLPPRGPVRSPRPAPVLAGASGPAGRYRDDDDIIYDLRAGDGECTLRFGTSTLRLLPGARGWLADDQPGFGIEAAAGGIWVRPHLGVPRYCHRLGCQPAAASDAGYAGAYYSQELDTVLHIEATSTGALRLRRTGWAPAGLEPLAPGLFLAAVPLPAGRDDMLLTIRFSADRTELRLGHPQARRLRFARLNRPHWQ